MKTSSYIRRKSCRLCDSSDLELVIELKPTPPANAFVTKDKINLEQTEFPLDIYFCRCCYHVQLIDVIDPKVLFSDYVYHSGTSPQFVDHFRGYAADIISQFKPEPSSLVIDIGSNDGTLLSFFKDSGFSVLGVDPATFIAERANQNGIETLNSFFNQTLATEILNKRGNASVITANNVFAHVDDLKDITQGVRSLLAPNGIFVFEVSYLADVIQDTLFDTIYHEHLSYHSLEPLQRFFSFNGMDMVAAYRVTTHGGSLRGICQLKGGPYVTDESVEKIINQERRIFLNKSETFKKFAQRVEVLQYQLSELLNKLKSDGKMIAGYGAPAKATTLMYQFCIDHEVIDFIVDDSPFKQGLYSPGKHIYIVSPSEIDKQTPDFLLVFAWNFAKAIIDNNQGFKNKGGQFIIPLPKLKVC